VTALPNLFDTLDAPTESALRESIRRFGVLVPVVRDQHGRTLDGHHRSRIADEEKVSYRVDVVTAADDEEAREISVTLNADRRQLGPDQRREIVASLRENGHSLRAIAGAIGVSEPTVRRDVEKAIASGDAIQPDRVRRQGGGSYPAKRPTIVAAKNEREAERAQEALATAEVPAGRTLDVKRVERIAREQAAESKRAEPVEPITEEDDIVILAGDFRDVLNDRDLCDGIVITDPPYPREFLEAWGDMAGVTLAAGCQALIAMTGQSILPDALDAIRSVALPPVDEYIGEQAWRYRWTAAYLTTGPATRVWQPNVGTSWKPVIAFDRFDVDHKYDVDRDFLTSDVFRSTGDDKHHHYWGQNENGIAALVEAFTKPGDLVVDPFLGGGTTAVVCRALGRRFVGCDIDSAAVETTRKRLAA
jgi:ParB-like chromosome segregation protein Spo0J